MNNKNQNILQDSEDDIYDNLDQESDQESDQEILEPDVENSEAPDDDDVVDEPAQVVKMDSDSGIELDTENENENVSMPEPEEQVVETPNAETVNQFLQQIMSGFHFSTLHLPRAKKGTEKIEGLRKDTTISGGSGEGPKLMPLKKQVLNNVKSQTKRSEGPSKGAILKLIPPKAKHALRRREQADIDIIAPIPVRPRGFPNEITTAILGGFPNETATAISRGSKINIESLEKNTNPQITLASKKRSEHLNLNVGGKYFSVSLETLQLLRIDIDKLTLCSEPTEDEVLFLDRDPFYFEKAVDIAKKYGNSEKRLLSAIKNESEQFRYELCLYGLLKMNHQPQPKIYLRYMKYREREKSNFAINQIITIKVQDMTFQTTALVLSRSSIIEKQSLEKDSMIIVNDTAAKIFRYVVNFLRLGNLFVINSEVIRCLDRYNIPYTTLDHVRKTSEENVIINHKDIKQTGSIITPHLPNLEEELTLETQLDAAKATFNLMCTMMRPKDYFTFVDIMTQTVLLTESQLKFDSDIVFDLMQRGKSEIVTGFVLCVDMPVLKTGYQDLMEYKILESVSLVLQDTKRPDRVSVIASTHGKAIYFDPVIYNQNSELIHAATQGRNVKMIYGNDLIDVYRISYILNIVDDRRPLPIESLRAMNKKVNLVIHLASTDKFLETSNMHIDLLNICLRTTAVKLLESSVDKPMIYQFQRRTCITAPIVPTANPHYETVLIPLDQYRLISDFYILTPKNQNQNQWHLLSDDLIETHVLTKTKASNMSLFISLDAHTMNVITPLRRYGTSPSLGVYYHNFESSDGDISTGFHCLTGSYLKIRVKKGCPMIILSINAIHYEIC